MQAPCWADPLPLVGFAGSRLIKHYIDYYNQPISNELVECHHHVIVDVTSFGTISGSAAS